jgi:transposase
MKEGIKWTTRVPSTLNFAKDLLASDLAFNMREDQCYSFYKTNVEYGGIEQKLVVVHSTEMQNRKEVTFDRNVRRKVKESQKDLKDLKKVKFACEEDARGALEIWKKENPDCFMEDTEISTISTKENGKKGKPRKNEKLIVHYVVDAKVVRNDEITLNEKKVSRKVFNCE